MRRSSLVLLLLALSLPAFAQMDPRQSTDDAAVPQANASDATTLRFPTRAPNWDWLAGTYWYVPQEDLPALLYDKQAQTQTVVPDQTVFHIVESSGGYFRGAAVVQIGTSRTPFTMLGSVTPDGSVLLDFVPSDSTGVATSGIGRFTTVARETAMLNQMSSSPNERLKVLHWAYMLQTRPGDASWNSLPGVNIPVLQFLGGK